MKKLYLSVLSCILCLASMPMNIHANSNASPSFVTLYNKQDPISVVEVELYTQKIEINNRSVLVYYTESEIYYFDETGNKILLAAITEDEGEFDNDEIPLTRGGSMSQFKKDFMVNTSSQKSMKTTNNLIILAANVIADILSGYLLNLLSSSFWTTSGISASLTVIAYAIKESPPESIVYYNITNYKNKNCTQYLSGRTFNVKFQGKLSPLLYDYTWLENPQLGVVSTPCKLAAQTWTYPRGGGQ